MPEAPSPTDVFVTDLSTFAIIKLLYLHDQMCDLMRIAITTRATEATVVWNEIMKNGNKNKNI